MNVNSIGGPSPSGAMRPLSEISTNPIVSKHLASPEIQSVLNGLGIKPQHIHQVSHTPGGIAAPALTELYAVLIDPTKAEVLRALGFGAVDLAIVVSSEDEISRVKKRLNQIKETITDRETILKLMKLLGLPEQDDVMVISDHQGGVLIVQSGLKELIAASSQED